jgi:hypothetical protein
MKTLFALSFATLYGFTIHLLFLFFQGLLEIMSITFLALVPWGIGYLTVALSDKEKMRSSWNAFFRPWLSSLALLVITILVNTEGAICWIMIFPFFALFAGLGGSVARYVMLRKDKIRAEGDSNILDDVDDWGPPNSLKSTLLLMLPLVLGLVEGDRTQTQKTSTVECSIVLPTAPEVVWAQLLRTPHLSTVDTRGIFTRTLDFPRHLSTTLDTAALGGKRIATYERGLVFEETITQYEPERYMELNIYTDPAKVPPTVLDEHIVIGGKYIHSLIDRYRLEPLSNGGCKVTLTGQYTINTPINWYCDLWARWVVTEMLEGTLGVNH